MSVLEEISQSGGYVSWARHESLKGIVRAASKPELEIAHDRVLRQLKDENIWVAIDHQGSLLSRYWPKAPGAALVSFPDQGTALQVLKEIESDTGQTSFRAAAMSYTDAIKSANASNALLVMVTYDETSPHYVPISRFGVHNEAAVTRKAWWKFW